MQRDLFGPVSHYPHGLGHDDDFLTPEQESDLLAVIHELPLHEAHYKEFTARRRIVAYGGTYDFTTNELREAAPIPAWLIPLEGAALLGYVQNEKTLGERIRS